MSGVKLPSIISAYFAAKGGESADETLACFTDDATVWDNGEDLELKGIENIRSWMEGTVSGYKLTSEVVSGDQHEDDFVAGVVVTGDFPGSPYKFEYRFKLKDNKIAELAIDPIGSLAE